MWRLFFKGIDTKRDYIYNFRDNCFNRIQKYCYKWYFYAFLKNNMSIDHEELNNFN